MRKTFSLRSYQPSWSIHWRRISMGGCAPYVSSAGMLRSSTKTTQRLPIGGPKTPLRRLSSLRVDDVLALVGAWSAPRS